MGFTDLQTFQSAHKRWVQASLQGNDTQRQSYWTKSIATGSESFVEDVKNTLDSKR